MKLVRALVLICMFSVCAFAEKPAFEDWRSTETTTALTNVLVTTGSIYIESILVTTGTSAGNTFTYYNSSTTDLSVSRSTSAVYDTNTSGTVYLIKETLSKGFIYTKAGASHIRVRWQYINGANPGERNKGIK